MGKRKNRHGIPHKVVAKTWRKGNGKVCTVVYKLDCGHAQEGTARVDFDGTPIRLARRMTCSACDLGEEFNKPFPGPES